MQKKDNTVFLISKYIIMLVHFVLYFVHIGAILCTQNFHA